MNDKDLQAIISIKAARNRLTVQQYRTLRGQVLAGDSDGAIRGLNKILNRKEAKHGDETRHNTQPCRRK